MQQAQGPEKRARALVAYVQAWQLDKTNVDYRQRIVECICGMTRVRGNPNPNIVTLTHFPCASSALHLILHLVHSRRVLDLHHGFDVYGKYIEALPACTVVGNDKYREDSSSTSESKLCWRSLACRGFGSRYGRGRGFCNRSEIARVRRNCSKTFLV